MRVMVIGADGAVADWLCEQLAPRGITVILAEPGPELIPLVRAYRPHVAVLDGIHARPQMASMEVALLKDQHNGIRIIAMSDEPSELDAEVVEQGIYCYLGGCSREELLRVIESAARETGRQRSTAETNLWSVP
jgi:DNA-binding response OmpR family regulator